MTFSTPRGNADSSRNRPLIYLDHNATTPISERVRSRLPEWAEHWGNPSSIHQSSRGPKQLMRETREKIARLLGVHPLELIFTSGGSEANNLALKGVFEYLEGQAAKTPGVPHRKRYLVSAVEHPSLVRTAEYLKSRGADVEFIPVRRDGSINFVEYERLLTNDTALVSVMYANNETGNVFPVKQMAEMAHAKGALFHSDCVQALGKEPLHLKELGVDLASFAGHKFYALKGAGFLFVRRGVQLESLVHGGGQERHRRGGTENVLAIASLGVMCDMKNEIEPQRERLRVLRDRLEARLLAEIPELTLTGAESPRLVTTSSMLIPGVDGETLLMNLDLRGFAVSTGAACSSGNPEPSPVLLAMGLTRDEAQSSLRVSLGWGTTDEEIDLFVDELKAVVAHLRSIRETVFEHEPED
jgi:cysteine desulfurase